MKKAKISILAGVCVLGSSMVFPVWADAEKGQAFFSNVKEGNCGTCHYLDDKKLVGPGMENVTKRRSEGWLSDWLKDPQKVWSTKHPETLQLRKEVRKKRQRYTSCVKPEMSTETHQDLMDLLKSLEK